MRRRNRTLKRKKHKTITKNTIVTTIILTLGLIIGYSAFQTNIDISATGKIREKSRIIRSWTSDSTDDFHNPEYREKIVSATFLNTRKIPAGVERSWNVSADGKGGVVAYVTINEEDYTKYNLYIGANDGVIANKDSRFFFHKFPSLKIIDFNTNFDTSNVTDMSNMFSPIVQNTGQNVGSSLEKINGLENWNTSNVIYMAYMFEYNTLLNEINISTWNTTNVQEMQGLFLNCQKLEEINVSSFNTSNVIRMQYMFQGCKGLTELDISSFNTNKVRGMHFMFADDTNLTTIYVSENFVTTSVINSDNMFLNDAKLTGSNNTTYNSNYVDGTYARIDKTGTPGYLTLKE